MRSLRSDWPNVPLISRSFFLSRRPHGYPARAAIEADPVNRPGLHNCRVVNISVDRDIYVAVRTVIREMSVVPTPAIVAVAKITESIAHSAVETHLGSPVTFM